MTSKWSPGCNCCGDGCPDLSIEVSGVSGTSDCPSLTCSNMNGTYLVSSVYSTACVFFESCDGPTLPNGSFFFFSNGVVVSYDEFCQVTIRVFTSVRNGFSGANKYSLADYSYDCSSLSTPQTLTPTSTTTNGYHGITEAVGCDFGGFTSAGPFITPNLCDLSSLVVKLV